MKMSYIALAALEAELAKFRAEYARVQALPDTTPALTRRQAAACASLQHGIERLDLDVARIKQAGCYC